MLILFSNVSLEMSPILNIKCWARDGGAINWALQPVWDVPEQNKKLDYFCSTEVGNPSPCTLGGKVINGGNTLEFSVLLACFIALLTFSV